MSEVFQVLPFGDLWCVAFVPSNEVRGLCAICRARDVAHDIVEQIHALPGQPQFRVCIGGSDAAGQIPGVDFVVQRSGETVVLDWLQSGGSRDPVTFVHGPGVDPKMVNAGQMQEATPSSKPYPQSLREMQSLLG